MKKGLTILLIVGLCGLGGSLMSLTSDVSNAIFQYFSWFAGILTVIGYYCMSGNASLTDDDANYRTKAVLLSAIGFLYSLIILVDNSFTSIFISLAGAIIWLIGVSKMKACGNQVAGLGALTTYGILTIISSLFQLIPGVGGYIGILFQIPAFITLSVGFSRFHSNPFFHDIDLCGMKTLSTIAFFCIGGALTFLIPVIGESISGFVLCLVFMPIILYAWDNALKAQSFERIPVEERMPTLILSPEESDELIEIEIADQPVEPEAIGSESIQDVENNPDEPEPDFDTQGSNKNTLLIIGICFLLIAGGFCGYKYMYIPYKTDKDAPRYYTYSNNTNLRSTAIAGVDFNVLHVLPYGSELILYNKDYDWSEVKHMKKKGYIASPFILSRSEFYLLNSIFGDSESFDCIETAKCRMALIKYYKENQIYGKPNVEMPSGYASTEQNWQVFSKNKNIKPNTIFYSRVIDKKSKFTDFAVIIKNANTGNRKLLLFSFSDDESPILFYEEYAPATGDIQSITSFINRYGERKFNVSYID